MSLRSAFPQFGGKSPSRTPRMAVMCNPSRADLPHRVHAPGCAGHTDRHSRALFEIDSGRRILPTDDFTVPLGIRLPFAFDTSSGELGCYGHSATEICRGRSLPSSRPASATIDRSDFLLLSALLSYPFGLALARAETLRPAPGAALLRATPARPPGFGSPANISNLSQTRLQEILPVPPKKHVPRLGSSSLSLSGCPSQTGRKGVTDACISIA